MSIHPTAIIDPTAQIGSDVSIGPYSIIGPHCMVGDNTRIDSHVVLQNYVTMGSDCQICPGAVVGGLPQDMKYKGEVSYVRIGNGVILREGVTVHRASGEGCETVVGDKTMLMANSHVAHNCVVGNEVVLANGTLLGGHVEVGDYSFIGGGCALHQFVKVGRMVILGGLSATRQDLPPFAMMDSRPAFVVGLNKVGLKRRGVDLATRTRLKHAYKLLFFSPLNYKQAIEVIKTEIEPDPAVTELIEFIQNSSKGVYRIRRKTSAKAANTEQDELEMLSQTML
jgi:UDP-N-acetylglucosamine acyltransferase